MPSFVPRFALAIVGAGHWRGQLSMSCCPGATAQPLSARVSLDELERDIGTIARWGAKALVTLLDAVELARLHVQKLSSLAPAAKLPWYHVPLPIGMLPDAEFDRSWNNISLRLQDILREGGKVSMHCRDGDERTGFMSARLLIELGCHPQDAMNRVCAARPGILRSAKLMDYLRSMQPGRLNSVAPLGSLNGDSNPAVALDAAMEPSRRGLVEPTTILAIGAQHRGRQLSRCPVDLRRTLQRPSSGAV